MTAPPRPARADEADAVGRQARRIAATSLRLLVGLPLYGVGLVAIHGAYCVNETAAWIEGRRGAGTPVDTKPKEREP